MDDKPKSTPGADPKLDNSSPDKCQNGDKPADKRESTETEIGSEKLSEDDELTKKGHD